MVVVAFLLGKNKPHTAHQRARVHSTVSKTPTNQSAETLSCIIASR